MTIQLSPYTKTGIMNIIETNSPMFTTTSRLRLYPTSVAMPTAPINTVSVPAGWIVLYNSSLTYTLSGNTISVTGGTTSSTALFTDTIGWWMIAGALSGEGCMFSDSVGLSGEGKIVTVNTMTPTNGQAVNFTFNLTLV